MRTVRGWQLQTGMLVKGLLDGPTTGPQLVLDTSDKAIYSALFVVNFMYTTNFKIVSISIPLYTSDHDERSRQLRHQKLHQNADFYYGLDRWTVICESV